jgi:hypothetical protein
VIVCLIFNTAKGQALMGFEEYFFSGTGGSSAMVSQIYYQNGKNWYFEARNNYEADQAFSMYIGKTFSREDSLSFSFTPMAGIVAGEFHGGSFGADITMGFKSFVFNAELQYTLSADKQNDSFLYGWTELGYRLTRQIYLGLALQQTNIYHTVGILEPGVELKFSFGKWEIPVYSFNPIDKNRYIVVGICRQFEFKKK